MVEAVSNSTLVNQQVYSKKQCPNNAAIRQTRTNGQLCTDTFGTNNKEDKKSKISKWGKIGAGIGIVALAIAGIFWGKEKINAKKAKELEAEARKLAEETRLRAEQTSKQTEEIVAKPPKEANIGTPNKIEGKTPESKAQQEAINTKAEPPTETEVKPTETKETPKQHVAEPKRISIPPIESEKEYNEIMDRIRNSKAVDGSSYYEFIQDLENYPNITPDEYGLLPYIGFYDKSEHINKFLSGRLNLSNDSASARAFNPADESVIIDMVRCLEYSLGKVDSRLGKYKGIVFRQGYMSEESGTFLSTSFDASFVANRSGGLKYSKKYEDYNVIRVKNGHNIHEVQKENGNSFAAEESEILMDRKSKFRAVPLSECDEDLLKAREELASSFFDGRAADVISGKKESLFGYTREDFLEKVKIWEEI